MPPKIKKRLIIIFGAILALFYFLQHHEHNKEELISLFPIENYDQNISHWIKPTDSDYKKLLLSPAQQKMRYEEWYDHNYGGYSPWNKNYLDQLYATIGSGNLKSLEQQIIDYYSNQGKSAQKIAYRSNFRLYSGAWADNLQNKMNLKQFDAMRYEASNRAIAVDNIHARILPTDEVHFYNSEIPGQGYPFDNLAVSTIWAGTPLYIIGETLEQDWALVLCPSFIAWVKSTDLARADDEFVRLWQESAQKKLVAILATQIPIKDREDQIYRFPAYIGMAFPGTVEDQSVRILIPVSDEKNKARIHSADLTKDQAASMPWPATPANFVTLMHQLIGRPYGWGGIYFYNDCALELKSLYTPFGIWLPMRSADQTDPAHHQVEAIDLSDKDLDYRLNYLKKYGHKFITIVYVDRHVLMFLGNYPNPRHTDQMVPLSYQNVWSLHLKKDYGRSVIGKAVLFPILPEYPEDSNLLSHANEKTFKLAWLDTFPKQKLSPKINLRSLLDFEPPDSQDKEPMRKSPH